MGRSAAFVITGLDKGGAETQIVRLACGLARRDWRVRLSTFLRPQFFQDVLSSHGVELRGGAAARGRPEIGPAFAMARDLWRDRPDVLVSFLYHPNLFSRLVGPATGVPVVNSIRGEQFEGVLREPLLRLTSGVPAHTVVNSTRARDRLLREGIVQPESSSVIVNGINVDAYQDRSAREATRASLGVTEDEHLWVAVGRIEPPKDYRAVLGAFARLVESGLPPQRLVVVGDGPQRLEMEQLAVALGIDGLVWFVGIREDVPHLLAAADAFVFASESEGLPNVIMEAQAAGLPVVATEVGGVPELVRDGETGWLVATSAPDALADRMVRVVAEPLQSRRLGERAAAATRQQFGLGRYIDAWESLLNRVVANSALRRPPSRSGRGVAL
ncbi:MAG: glycosyltransferase [Bacteroidota bacterium]